MNRNDLTEDQNLAIDRLFNFDETFLIAPTGAGKTVIVLTAIAELMEQDWTQDIPRDAILDRVLIIAPLKVCLTTWANEAPKWDHLKHLEIALAVGDPAEREEVIDGGANIVVINEENVEWLCREYDIEGYFDGIVIDETSRWSKTGGVRFKAIRHKMKLFKWRVGMTAEPVSENWVRLFGQLLLIDLGKALGRSKDRFLRKHFFPTDYDQRNWEVFPGQAEVIADKIRSLVHIMPDYKAETLPDKTVTVVPITLEKEAFRRYNRMRIDSVLKVGTAKIEAGSAAVLSGKLCQIAAGFSYVDDEEETAAYHHSQKIDWAYERALEIVSDGESVIIVYWFRWELDRLRSLFLHALEINGTPKQIRQAMADWQDDAGQIMLLQPSSASHGVDGLQNTCHRQLWLGPIWSRDCTIQAQDRLWRRGQTRPVEIEIAVATGTVDEIKWASVENKADYHELLLEHLGGSDGMTLDERERLEASM